MRLIDCVQRLGWYVLAVVLLWSPIVLGSVIIYPARMELEVPQYGATRQLTIENRGLEAVRVRLSSGMGTHTVEGAPIYLDDPTAVEESRRWIAMDTDELMIPAGQRRDAIVRFHPDKGAVSAYPMIFAEIHPEEGGSNVGASAVMVPRIAIPVLLTYAESIEQRTVSTETVSMTLREITDVFADQPIYEVNVVLRNTGNVHDVVRGRIDWLSSKGIISEVTPFEGHTILPNAERVFRTYWHPQEQSLDNIRLVATFFGNEWTGLSRPVAFHRKDGQYALADVETGTLLQASFDPRDEVDEER